MKVRRALTLSAILLTFGSLSVAACGDGDTVYVYVDGGAGGPDTGKRDGTTRIDDDSGEDLPTTCEPSPVPDFTFTPPPAYPALCADADINSFLLNCVFDEGTQASCNATIDQLSDACGNCMVGGFNSTPAAPLVRYSESAPFYANSGTCMSNIVNSTTDECAVAFGQVETCAYAACVRPCVGLTDTAKQACYDKAIGTICTKGVQTFDSTKCRTAYTGKTYGFCLSGDKPDASAGTKLNNLEYYTLVTRLACGSNPTPDAGTPVVDSGIVDSGKPDADAGAPDADASPPSDAGRDADADATP